MKNLQAKEKKKALKAAKNARLLRRRLPNRVAGILL